MSSRIFLTLCLLSAVCSLSGARMGFDISAFIGPIECFDDIAAAGHSFMIIELQSSKVWNKDLIHNINNARAAGINDIDVYLFPQKNRTAEEQVHSSIKFLLDNNVEFNTYWIDVEEQKYWFDTCDENIKFLQDMISSALDYLPQERVGIYTSNHYWEPMFCSTTAFSGFQLWWPRYDNNTSIDNYVPFGGWQKPVMKQYLDLRNVSCAVIDLNWKD